MAEPGVEVSSKEVEANFHLERRPLCPPEFLDERMQQRLQRRLRKSAHLRPPNGGMLSSADLHHSCVDVLAKTLHDGRGVRHEQPFTLGR